MLVHCQRSSVIGMKYTGRVSKTRNSKIYLVQYKMLQNALVSLYSLGYYLPNLVVFSKTSLLALPGLELV